MFCKVLSFSFLPLPYFLVKGSPTESIPWCYFSHLVLSQAYNEQLAIYYAKDESEPEIRFFLLIECVFQEKTFRTFSHSSSHNLLWNTGAGFVGT